MINRYMQKKSEKNKKIKLGIFSFTCCEGCSVVFIELMNKRFFEYKELFDFKSFRQLQRKGSNKIVKMDLAIIEGAICNKKELDKLKEIRKKAKKVLCIGSCAVDGMPSSQRNFFSISMKKKIEPLVVKLKQFKTVEPLYKFIKVDDKINGCPININELDKKIEELFDGLKK